MSKICQSYQYMDIVNNSKSCPASVLTKLIYCFFYCAQRLISFSWWRAVAWVGYYTNLLQLPQTCTSFIIHKRTVNPQRVELLSIRQLPKSTPLSDTSQLNEHQVESALWTGCCCDSRAVSLHDVNPSAKNYNDDCAYSSVRVYNCRIHQLDFVARLILILKDEGALTLPWNKPTVHSSLSFKAGHTYTLIHSTAVFSKAGVKRVFAKDYFWIWINTHLVSLWIFTAGGQNYSAYVYCHKKRHASATVWLIDAFLSLSIAYVLNFN